MSFDRILILGAGAIGSVYGAFLSENNRVTLIGNRPHMDAINAIGLSIVGDMRKTFRPEATTEIGNIPRRTLVLLTTKAHESARAIRRTRTFLKKDTVILVLQNGLGNEEIVKRLVAGRSKVLRGVTTIAAEFSRPGRIRYWRGKTIIESDDDSKKIATVFNACGLETKLSENINREVWTKLVLNCVVNPLTTILHVRNCKIGEDSLKGVRHAIVRECFEVAKAEKMVLPRSLTDTIDKWVASFTNFSSMYQDVAKGRRTEIDFLNGKIVELGKKHHIQTPVNETLVGFIKFLEGESGIPRND